LVELPQHCRVGVGVVNQKLTQIETVPAVLAKAEAAVELFGAERVLLNPDCGFATFADNPIAPADLAQAKLAVVAQAAGALRTRLADTMR
jgi:5-methyltetrahydropteroyltriglutamate--homocysteine methyltransferase